MIRNVRWMAVAAWVALGAVGAVWAAEEKAPAAKPAEAQLGGGWGGAGLPGYNRLQMESVQKELMITPEQKEKFKKITDDFYASMRDEQKVDWNKIRELPAEEQKKFYDEVRERYTKRMEDVKKQVEGVLLPQQLEQLKKMEEQERVSMLLYSPQILEQIGLTEEQKAAIQKVREDAQAKMQQLQRESVDKTFKVLKPEQVEKLKEMAGKGFPGFGQPGQPLVRPERTK